ncbi:MAG TPA: hypothetical protein VHA33_21360 [Candidatus Angelobacter sp.]|nr:hypothetical protein [Candidatus Angelobacter sp.]
MAHILKLQMLKSETTEWDAEFALASTASGVCSGTSVVCGPQPFHFE